MKRFINLLLIIVLFYSSIQAFNEAEGLKKARYYPINSRQIKLTKTEDANRNTRGQVRLIGSSSYDHYPCSYNNWGMGYEESRDLTYIVFTDCDDIEGVDFSNPSTFNRVISYNVIDSDDEPMLSPEGEAEATFAGYPDMITAVNGRPYVAFHKNHQGYYPWIKGDQYNLGGTQVIWNSKCRSDDAHANWIWPQIRMTRPNDGTEGVIYMMGTESDDPNGKAEVYRAIPVLDDYGYLADPFFTFDNANIVINEEESILHPSMAVSEDGSVTGVFYTTGEASTAAAKYVYSTDEGATWSEPVNLAFDNSPCDIDQDGQIDGNWSVSGTGSQLFFNSNNEPCVAYVKNVTAVGGTYYPFTSKVFFGKIDINNAELIEHRVSEGIDPEYDITGGCCGPNAKSVGARVAWYNGGEQIVIGWIDSRNNLAEECSNAEIYLAYSEDWGENWSVNLNVSNTMSGTFDKDETWLYLAPQMEYDETTDSLVIRMMYMWDESPGNSVSDEVTGGEITMNQICYNTFCIDPFNPPPVNGIESVYTIAPKQDITLRQNKPNPFNPTTSITFDIAEADEVKLSVYNIKGELINVLADKFYNKGSHTLVWNGKDSNNQSVSSGIYFYTMETSQSSETKKMILLK